MSGWLGPTAGLVASSAVLVAAAWRRPAPVRLQVPAAPAMPTTTRQPRGRGRTAAVVTVLSALGLIAPPLAIAGAGVLWLRPRHHAAREQHRRGRELARALPDAVDLLALCTSAGLALPIAHHRLAMHLPPPIGDALRAAEVETDHGRPRADALVAALGPLGQSAGRLAQVLAEHLRYGSALGPSLDGLGRELRGERRRLAEQEARKVPVRLLAPLVACVLPAFGLLTVVPLLVASLRSLPT